MRLVGWRVHSHAYLYTGTEILVDETVLTTGQLTQEGVANLKALGNLIQWQRLNYDFQFHTAEFDSDLVKYHHGCCLL